MNYYGSELARGTALPSPLSDYEDDPLQMGGNAIFNAKGRIIFLHPSEYPADRPTVEKMLEVLRVNED